MGRRELALETCHYEIVNLIGLGLVVNYGEGGLQNETIADPKLFAPPPQDRVKTCCAPPPLFKLCKLFAPPNHYG